MVEPTNSSDGGESLMSLMFHAASPASLSPALSPTRGSGVGATVDLLDALAAPVRPDDAQAARDKAATMQSSVRSDFMTGPIWVRVLRQNRRPASAASARFRSSDRRRLL